MDPISLLNMLESKKRYDQAQQQEQDQKIAGSMLQRLESFREDPTRFKAFRDTAIMAQPRIREAMERVYTPEGLSGLLSDKQLETPEERFMRKQKETLATEMGRRKAELLAESDPQVFELKAANKRREAGLEAEISVSKPVLEAKRIGKLHEQAVEAELGETPAMKRIQQQKFERDNSEKFVPEFRADYDQMAGTVTLALGGSDEEAAKTFNDYIGDKYNGPGQSGEPPLKRMIINYQRARLYPEGTIFKTPGGKEITEEQYKTLERELANNIRTGKELRGGKVVPLDDKRKNQYLRLLMNSPITDGPSPWLFGAAPWLRGANSKVWNKGESKKVMGILSKIFEETHAKE